MRKQMIAENGIIFVKNRQVYEEETDRIIVDSSINAGLGDSFAFDLGYEWEERYEPLQEELTNLKIAAIIDSDPYDEVFGSLQFLVPLSLAKELFPAADEHDSTKPFGYMIYLSDESYEEEAAEEIKSLITNRIDLQFINRMDEVRESRSFYIQIYTLVFGFVIVVALIGAINIVNTVTTNLLLRKQEIAMLQAIGMTGGDVRKMIAAEGVIYGLFGAFFGTIFGVINSFILYLILLGVRLFQFSLDIPVILIGAVSSIVIGIVSALLPLRKLKHENVMDNLRDVD